MEKKRFKQSFTIFQRHDETIMPLLNRMKDSKKRCLYVTITNGLIGKFQLIKRENTNGLGVTVLELSLYENTALIICFVLYVGSVIVYISRKFSQERELEKSEITAELEMLADESYKKQKIKEDHEASHHLNANKF